MDKDAVFKRYDIRGEYPQEIDERFAELLGKSLGTFVKNDFEDKVVVSRDNKTSSKPLKQSFIQGLVSTGVDVLDAGEGPTDYTAYTGRKNNAVSVQVTSSHLPLSFNGFKFMYPEGNGFLNPDLDTVKNIFREEQFDSGNAEVKSIEDSFDHYQEDLKDFAREKAENWDRKIVIDSLGGATDPVLRNVLEQLGAEVVDLAENQEQKPYRDPPNPKPCNLKELKEKVKDMDADLGLATDMDGDRLTVYKDGFIDGSDLFGILAQVTEGDVVASIDSSNALEKILESREDSVYYTRVGDPFVMDKALEEDVELAGEPNGHYAFLDFVPYNSGTLAGLVLAGIDIDRYLERLPDYFTERRSNVVENKTEVMDKLERQLEEKYGINSRKDGLKIETSEFNVLIRPSGSSPKIRTITESRKQKISEEVADLFEEMVRNP